MKAFQSTMHCQVLFRPKNKQIYQIPITISRLCLTIRYKSCFFTFLLINWQLNILVTLSQHLFFSTYYKFSKINILLIILDSAIQIMKLTKQLFPSLASGRTLVRKTVISLNMDQRGDWHFHKCCTSGNSSLSEGDRLEQKVIQIQLNALHSVDLVETA